MVHLEAADGPWIEGQNGRTVIGSSNYRVNPMPAARFVTAWELGYSWVPGLAGFEAAGPGYAERWADVTGLWKGQ